MYPKAVQRMGFIYSYGSYIYIWTYSHIHLYMRRNRYAFGASMPIHRRIYYYIPLSRIPLYTPMAPKAYHIDIVVIDSTHSVSPKARRKVATQGGLVCTQSMALHRHGGPVYNVLLCILYLFLYEYLDRGLYFVYIYTFVWIAHPLYTYTFHIHM